jgi:hypothetical protein
MAIRCDQRRQACRTIAFNTKKRMKIGRKTREKNFIRERTLYLILIKSEPVKRFKNRRNVMKVRSFVTARAAAFRKSCNA